MADINVQQSHTLGADKAREEVEKLMARMMEKMGLTIDWNGNHAQLKGSGIKKASIVLTDDQITVEITLALLAKPMKGMIEGKIRNKFARLG